MPEIFNSAQQPSTPTVETAVDRLSTEDRRARNVDEYSQIMRAEQPTRNPFAAFAAKPLGVAFEAQNSQEQVLLLLRQSLVTQGKYVIITIVLILLPLLFNYVGLLTFLPERFQFVAALGWYMLIIGYVLEVFLDWFYNVYIVTDERIIDVDFSSLLYKSVSYAKIDLIQDISATTTGALGAIFDFGSVKIETAGAAQNLFEFTNVPHPSKVVGFLNEMLIEEQQEKLDGRAV